MYCVRTYNTWRRRAGGTWTTCESDTPDYEETFATIEAARDAYEAIVLDQQIDPRHRRMVSLGIISDVRHIRELGSSTEDTLEIIEREEVTQD